MNPADTVVLPMRQVWEVKSEVQMRQERIAALVGRIRVIGHATKTLRKLGGK